MDTTLNTSNGIFAQRDLASTGDAPDLPVLLVEDNEVDVDITKRVLSKSGAPVRLCIARDGEEALTLLTHGQSSEAPELPRLVLLDLGLPGVDGRAIIKRLKADDDLSLIPLAVLSGASGDRPLLECMALGANMYYVKPLVPDDANNLISAVQKYWSIVDRLRRRAET
jgi:CheY-like chemotaxis protein